MLPYSIPTTIIFTDGEDVESENDNSSSGLGTVATISITAAASSLISFILGGLSVYYCETKFKHKKNSSQGIHSNPIIQLHDNTAYGNIQHHS